MSEIDFTKRAQFLETYFSSYTLAGDYHVISSASSQEIGDDIIITGHGMSGEIVPLAFSSEFSEPGLGVADPQGRWAGQIDYRADHDELGPTVSERLEFDFGGTVDSLFLTVGMLGAREGRDDQDNRYPETGYWMAYDEAGAQIATGTINPENSIAGNEGRYGEYRFTIDPGKPIALLAIEARPFGWPSAPASVQDDRGTNNSDIGITRISYDRVSYSDSSEEPEPDRDSNTAPVAAMDEATIDAKSVSFNVLANDFDADGDALSIASFTTPANGELVRNGAGSFTYTPGDDYGGADSFEYSIIDGEGGSATAKVRISGEYSEPEPEPGPEPIPEPAPGELVTAGLVARFEAKEASSIVLGDGGVVEGWRDLSGRGNHLKSAGDPTWVKGATPAGAAAIQFDGNGDLLTNSGALSGLVGGSGNRTMFVVMDYEKANGVYAGVSYGNGAGNEAFGLVASSSGQLAVQGWGRGNDQIAEAGAVAGGFLVQSVVLEDSAFEHFKNGTLIDSGSKTFATDVEKLILGSEIAGLGEAQMKIGAVLVYDRALSEAERSDVEAYLQQEYVTAIAEDSDQDDPDPAPDNDTDPDPGSGDAQLVAEGLVAAFQSHEDVEITGSVVTGWSDSSGWGNHLSAAGDPTLMSGGTPTGKASIAFDGTDDLLQSVGALTALPEGGEDRTMYFVVRYIDSDHVTAGFVYGEGEQNEAFGLVSEWSGGDLGVQGWAASNDISTEIDAADQGWVVQSVVLDDDFVEHYLDGELIDSEAHAFETALEELVLGAEISGLGEAKMEVAAALIYDRSLSESERGAVETYLQQTFIDEGFTFA